MASRIPKPPTREEGRRMYDDLIRTLVAQKEKLEGMIARIDAGIDEMTARRDRYFR
jgi:hypothetical protein